jgi:hypothetical protein
MRFSLTHLFCWTAAIGVFFGVTRRFWATPDWLGFATYFSYSFQPVLWLLGFINETYFLRPPETAGGWCGVGFGLLGVLIFILIVVGIIVFCSNYQQL